MGANDISYEVRSKRDEDFRELVPQMNVTKNQIDIEQHDNSFDVFNAENLESVMDEEQLEHAFPDEVDEVKSISNHTHHIDKE